MFQVEEVYRIKNNESFKMNNGFESFKKISKGTHLASSNGNKIAAKKSAFIFMPLYQNKGKEGYFIINKTPSFFLKLSTLLRNIKSDSLLTWLPGVYWESEKKEALQVNTNIARFFTKKLFHLLGYRNWQIDKTHIVMYNRERNSKKEHYKHTRWYKKSRF